MVGEVIVASALVVVQFTYFAQFEFCLFLFLLLLVVVIGFIRVLLHHPVQDWCSFSLKMTNGLNQLQMSIPNLFQNMKNKATILSGNRLQLIAVKGPSTNQNRYSL